MSKTNCINCGAAKDIDEVKCPFCGTTYLDLTAIDFSSDDPVVCQFILPYSKDRLVLSMLARPALEEITQTANTIDILGYGGRRLCQVTTGYDVNVGVSFKPIARKNGSLFELRQKSNKEFA